MSQADKQNSRQIIGVIFAYILCLTIPSATISLAVEHYISFPTILFINNDKQYK